MITPPRPAQPDLPPTRLQRNDQRMRAVFNREFEQSESRGLDRITADMMQACHADLDDDADQLAFRERPDAHEAA